MNKDTDHYKKSLLDERAELIEELKSVGVIKDKRHPDDWEATPGDADYTRADPNEVGDKLEAYEGNNAIVQELEQRLEDVDAALEKIKNNTFGICEVNGEAIEADRLEANPAAKTCKAHMNTR
jgi:RNA polymerase-binding transcription factor DksA